MPQENRYREFVDSREAFDASEESSYFFRRAAINEGFESDEQFKRVFAKELSEDTARHVESFWEV